LDCAWENQRLDEGWRSGIGDHSMKESTSS